MPDEAVLRIILEEQSRIDPKPFEIDLSKQQPVIPWGKGQESGLPPPPMQGPPEPPEPSPVPVPVPVPTPPPYTGSDGFEPVEEAQKYLEKKKRAKLVKAEIEFLDPFDPAKEALEYLEKKKRAALIKAEIEKITPPEPFDATAEAQKRLEREKKRAEIDAEYTKIAPVAVIPVFDPAEEAKKRRERELQKKQVDVAYQDQYGRDEKGGAIDNLLSVAGSMRGMLGGMFGPLVGAGLDFTSGMSKAGAFGGGKIPVAQATKATSAEIAKMPEVTPAKDAGGLEEMAAAAGPIGLAVELAKAVDKAVQGAIKSTVGTAGGIAASIASPSSDPAEPVAKLGDAASAAGEKLGGFGHGLVFAGESLKALSSVMQALDKTAQRYGEYSPEIAQAQAIAEIRQTMGDFRRAQTISTDIAKYVMAQSDLQQRVEDIKVKLLSQILPLVTQAVSTVESIMAAGENTADAISTLASPLIELVQAMKELVGLKRDENLPDPEDPTSQLLSTKFFEPNNPKLKGWAPDL